MWTLCDTYLFLEDECFSECGENWNYTKVQELPCEGTDAGESDETGYNCGSWDPTSAIEWNNGVYVVDETWLTDLINEGGVPVTACDDTTFELDQSSPARYVLSGADSGEAFYEIGMRNGDKVISVNGVSIVDVESAATIFESWLDGERTFEIVVGRTSGQVTLDVEVQ